MSELSDCDVNKSYRWDRDHNSIEDSNGQQSRHHHGEKRRNTTNTDNHGNAGTDGKFSGNYVAKFADGRRSVNTHVEDPGICVNGNEVRDVNTYKDMVASRIGCAACTIKTNGHDSWNDNDVGNTGKIVYGQRIMLEDAAITMLSKTTYYSIPFQYGNQAWP